MSYSNNYKFNINIKKSFKIICNCPKCGCKTRFVNTHRFRVNANGNKLDVWLIYQCEKCRHTRNLTVYERKNPDRIDKDEYQLFLENDFELADKLGKSKSFFQRNNSTVSADDIEYEYITEGGESLDDLEPDYSDISLITVCDKFHLNLRDEKILSDIFKCSRSKAKKMISAKSAVITKASENEETVYYIMPAEQFKNI